jgi:starch phosphorylase
MINGALTVGTRDGATIEMAGATGADQFFLFGLSAEEVAKTRGSTSRGGALRQRFRSARRPRPHLSNHFSQSEPDIFVPILDALL